MEFSDRKLEPNGQDLLRMITSLTGLPDDLIRGELDQMIVDSGRDSKNLTLQQLREVLVDYLESMEAELMDEDETAISD